MISVDLDLPFAGKVRIRWDSLVVTAIAGFVFQRLWEVSSFSPFQERDLTRALLASHGQPIFFGPEIYGGGTSPGGFYYWFLGILFRLGGGWSASWILMVALGAVAVGLTWDFFARTFGRGAAFTACALLLIRPSLPSQLQSFWNPSYLPVFLVLILIGLANCFARTGDSQRRWWYLICVLGGFAAQIHLMVVFLLASALPLQLSAGRLAISRIPRRVLARGLALGTLPLVPFGIWIVLRRLGIDLGQSPPEFTEPFLFFFDRLAHQWGIWSWVAPRDLLADHRVLVSLLVPLLIGFALKLLAVAKWIGPPDPPRGGSFQQRAGLVWDFSWAFAAIPVLASIPYGRGFRYLQLYSIVAAFATAARVHRYLRNRLSRSAVPAVVGPGALLLLALVASEPTGLESPIALSFDQYAVISRAIIARTQWSYEQARLRLFYLNVSKGPSALIYESVRREIAAPSDRDPPDGFFIFHVSPEGLVKMNASVSDWLLLQHLEPSVASALREGALQVEKPLRVGGAFLAGYHVIIRDRFLRGFHDFSEGYNEGLTIDARRASQHTDFPEGGEYADFNDCPDRLKYCTFRFTVATQRPKERHGKLLIRLDGEILSQSYDYMGGWEQALTDPYVSIQCAPDAVPQVFHLGVNVGKAELLSLTLLAPIEREVTDPCPEGIFKMAAGYGSARLFNPNFGIKRDLPGRSLPLGRF